MKIVGYNLLLGETIDLVIILHEKFVHSERPNGSFNSIFRTFLFVISREKPVSETPKILSKLCYTIKQFHGHQ